MDKRHLLPQVKTDTKKMKLGFTLQLFGWSFFIGIFGTNKKTTEDINVSDITEG